MYARSVFAVFAAGLAAMASAYTTPVVQSTGYSVFTPGLNEIVPAGKPYKITWEVSKPAQKTVTLILLRGPSTNIKYLSTIVEKTPNTGSFEWTPSLSLEADTTHYGIQLIVDEDGEYQYTTQFGISNPNPIKSSSSSAVASPSSKSAIISAASTPCTTSSAVVVSSHSANSTSAVITGTGTAYTTVIASTGYPVHNSSIIQPSKPLTVPSSLLTTATRASSPSSVAVSTPTGTGAASHVKAGLGLAGAIAGLVMAL